MLNRMRALSHMMVIMLILTHFTTSGQEDFSNGRVLGIGAQVGFPVIGISVRFWIQDAYGLEADYLPFFFVEVATLRGLMKIVNNPVADLYIAGGSTFQGSSLLCTHIAMGIEYSFAYEVALNTEVGIAAYVLTPGFAILFGGGIHFYF